MYTYIHICCPTLYVSPKMMKKRYTIDGGRIRRSNGAANSLVFCPVYYCRMSIRKLDQRLPQCIRKNIGTESAESLVFIPSDIHCMKCHHGGPSHNKFRKKEGGRVLDRIQPPRGGIPVCHRRTLGLEVPWPFHRRLCRAGVAPPNVAKRSPTSQNKRRPNRIKPVRTQTYGPPTLDALIHRVGWPGSGVETHRGRAPSDPSSRPLRTLPSRAAARVFLSPPGRHRDYFTARMLSTK